MTELLNDFYGQYYLWLKAFHVIAAVAWMAGLFYLPRLFVYHSESKNPEMHATFVVMEKRLYKIIMVPAMHTVILLGGILLCRPGFITTWNTYIKMICVFMLIMFQFYLNYCRQRLSDGTNQKTSRFFRIINEIPTLLLIIIIICAIVKPLP